MNILTLWLILCSALQVKLQVLTPRETTVDCSSITYLSPAQQTLCGRYPQHIIEVALGAEMAIVECEHQFRDERWNCSGVEDSSLFKSVFRKGNPEAAFFYAISAAGIVDAIVRGCASTRLHCGECKPGTPPKDLDKDWVWQGCSNHIPYGLKWAANFADARETERNHPRNSPELRRMLMNLHNNEAGRQAIRSKLKAKCKCHGVSGSCSLKSCFMGLPRLQDVGAHLKQRYLSAKRVRLNKKGTRLVPYRRRVEKRPEAGDLIYSDVPPNYCDAEPLEGSAGTVGRQCNATRGTCEPLCCGRGYATTTRLDNDNCDCMFVWCCKIKCKKCLVLKTLQHCN